MLPRPSTAVIMGDRVRFVPASQEPHDPGPLDVSTVGLAAALGAGFVSFASPCVLPVVPAYLSVVTGLEVAELEEGGHLRRIARDTGLFVAGFSTVFVLLGLTATALGRGLLAHQAQLTRGFGLLVLAFALFLAGSLVLQAPWLYQEKRFHPALSRFGPFAAPVAGVAFALGWTPCIGPVLGSVLAVAATDGQAGHGAALLGAYSVGLGLPFLLSGLLLGRLAGTFGWVRRHGAAVTLLASVSLAGFGVLLALDRLTLVTSELQRALTSVGLGRLVYLG